MGIGCNGDKMEAVVRGQTVMGIGCNGDGMEAVVRGQTEMGINYRSRTTL